MTGDKQLTFCDKLWHHQDGTAHMLAGRSELQPHHVQLHLDLLGYGTGLRSPWTSLSWLHSEWRPGIMASNLEEETEFGKSFTSCPAGGPLVTSGRPGCQSWRAPARGKQRLRHVCDGGEVGSPMAGWQSITVASSL